MVKTGKSVLVVLLLAVTVATVYWRTGDHSFLDYDDPLYVTNNPVTQGGLSRAGFLWAFTTFHANNWHPLTWLTHMAVVDLFGMDAGWHHRVNLLIHVVNTGLLFLLLRGMTGAPWRSAFVAALFGVHPLHVESVAWVAELKDVLSALFGLLTISAYVSCARRPSGARFLLVIVLFASGLMAKPMLVTLPFVLLLLDYWPLGRWAPGGRAPGEAGGWLPPVSRRRLILEKLPLLLLSAISCVVTYIAQGSDKAFALMGHVRPADRVANAAVSYLKYLGKMVWPTSLSVIYPHPAFLWGISRWEVVASVSALVLITGGVVWQASRRPFLAVGWFWYLGTLVPVIGLIQIGGHAMADRYTYFPLIGVFIALVWGISGIVPGVSFPGKLLAPTGVVLLAVLCGLSWRQAGYWKNGIALFSHALEAHPHNQEARSNLGNAYYNTGMDLKDRGNIPEAATHLREAAKYYPLNVDVLWNLGVAEGSLGNLDEAIRLFQTVTEIRPDDAQARQNLEMAFRLKKQRETGGMAR